MFSPWYFYYFQLNPASKHQLVEYPSFPHQDVLLKELRWMFASLPDKQSRHQFFSPPFFPLYLQIGMIQILFIISEYNICGI